MQQPPTQSPTTQQPPATTIVCSVCQKTIDESKGSHLFKFHKDPQDKYTDSGDKFVFACDDLKCQSIAKQTKSYCIACKKMPHNETKMIAKTSKNVANAIVYYAMCSDKCREHYIEIYLDPKESRGIHVDSGLPYFPGWPNYSSDCLYCSHHNVEATKCKGCSGYFCKDHYSFHIKKCA